jgi:hypothetical protein
MTPQEIAQKYLTSRYLCLDLYERVVAGTQYDGREPFLKVDSTTPLLERAPCIVDPIVEKARNAHCDFVLGEGRWPSFTTFASEDDREFDPDYGLNEADSKTLDLGIVKLCEHMRLRAAARTALENGLDCGTVATILCVRDGKLEAESVRAATCTPTFNRKRRGEVTSVEIRYPYLETYYDDAERREKQRCMLYRRVIDATSDTVYQPGECQEDGTEPEWVPDAAATSEHGLGFCPVVWHRMLAKECTPIDIDGSALHRGVIDEIEAYHFSLSQHHRASFYGGDPEKVEIGAEGDDGVSGDGRAAQVRVEADKRGAAPHPAGTYVASATTGGGGRVRRRGVHCVARYQNPNAKVALLTLPGDALDPIANNADRLREIICGAMRYVDMDLEAAKKAADASGVTVERVYQKQLAFDDTIREDFGNGWLQPVVDMALRILHVLGKGKAQASGNAGTASSAAGDVYLPGLKKIRPILARFEKTLTDASVRWFSPHVDLVWGPYFKPSPEQQKTTVETVGTAVEKKIITRQMALEKLKTEGVFPIQSSADVAAELEAADRVAVDAEAAKSAATEPDGDEPAVDPTTAGVVDGKQNAGAVVTVDELRAAMGLSPMGDETGKLTIPQLLARDAAMKAQAVAPASGAAMVPAASAPASSPPTGHIDLQKASSLMANAGDAMNAAQKKNIANESPAPAATNAGVLSAATPSAPGADTVDPASHKRASDAGAGIAQTIFSQLSEDFPPKSIEWVLAAQWRGPTQVPLDQIDFTNRHLWVASSPEEQAHVDEFVEQIEREEMTKPVILVNEGNDSKFMIIDGHHRVLAYEKAGRPVVAFVGDVGGVAGPWRDMHASQRGGAS